MLQASLTEFVSEINHGPQQKQSMTIGADLENGGGGITTTTVVTVQPVTGSPLGASSPSSSRQVFAQALGIIVGFFAEEWLEAVLGERQGLDILGIFVLILLLWMIISDWIQAWWATPMPEDKRIWSQGWVMFVHFISYALTLVVFRYLSVIVGEEWSRQGLTLGEGILNGIFFMIYFFFIYLYFLKQL